MKKGLRFDPTRIDPKTVRQVLIYGLLLFLLSVVQCSFLAQLKFLPATPDLILAALCALLLTEERSPVLIGAVAGGFLIDAIGTSGLFLSPLFYLAAALILAPIAAKLLPRFLSWLLLMLPALLLRLGYSALRLTLSEGVSHLLQGLLQVLLPELLLTLLLSIPVFFLVKLCVLLAGDRRERSLR